MGTGLALKGFYRKGGRKKAAAISRSRTKAGRIPWARQNLPGDFPGRIPGNMEGAAPR